jgi:hypothetical protein
LIISTVAAARFSAIFLASTVPTPHNDKPYWNAPVRVQTIDEEMFRQKAEQAASGLGHHLHDLLKQP